MLCGFVSETFDGFRPSARQTGTVTRSNRTTSGEVWVNIYLERQCAGGGHEFGRPTSSSVSAMKWLTFATVIGERKMRNEIGLMLKARPVRAQRCLLTSVASSGVKPAVLYSKPY